jgi:ferredoxin
MDKQPHMFHHALRIRQEACIGCSRCMRVCPTEALRVTGGKATLHPGLCVDCGECFNVCPSRALWWKMMILRRYSIINTVSS